MRNFTSILLLLLTSSLLSAQQSMKMEIPRGAVSRPADISVDYYPKVRKMEMPNPGGESYRAFLERQKALIPQQIPAEVSTSYKAANAAQPTLHKGFLGNDQSNGAPNDNDFAISNDGKIVSVVNSNIVVRDETGAGLLALSLDAWAAPLGLNANKYDPRALYDPVHDRFIIVCLNGTLNTTSNIIVGFSQTNDPTGNWNLYALPGDPYGDTLWTDYPIVAISEHEFFVTGNFIRNNEPWQTGFAGSVAWQVRLDEAYAGDSLQTRVWGPIFYNGGLIRNLCPVMGGSAPTAAPGLYFISNRNFDLSNDSIFIMEITDTLNGNPSYLVDMKTTPTAYGLPPNAIQRFGTQLATNDGRWLDAMIENDQIQFVGNCNVPGMNKAGIYHGLISDMSVTRTVTGNIISHPGDLDYGYPAIAPCDPGGGNDALIAVNYSSLDTLPSCGAIYFDAGVGYSDLLKSRDGVTYINFLSGSVERWGDYTGIQPRYNAPGYVWTAATFGRQNRYGTWISEWSHPTILSDNRVDPAPVVQTFPNPSTHFVKVRFEVTTPGYGDIQLFDREGRLVRVFFQDAFKSGVNEFEFSTTPLAVGTYLLQIQQEGTLLAMEKIVVAR